MDGQFIMGIVVSGILIGGLLWPFIFGPGGHLATAASINSPETLKNMKTQILERYIADEKAFLNKQISETSWKQRQTFLAGRYLDLARRLEFIEKTESKGV